MADPFSIASGVAGIISLGLTVCNEIHAYFSAIEGRNDDIEAALQQLALLRSNIEIIKSISSKLSTSHALATDGVSQGLKDCESHFKALESFTKELTTAGTSGSKQKWQNRKLIMMYPFNQKKLVQLHERLSKAQDTLENLVQSLILDVNVGVGDDLRAFRADVKASDGVTHGYLNKTTSQLDTIGPAVEHTSTELTRISTRVEEHVTYATSSHALLHAVNSRLLEQSTQMETIASSIEQMQVVHSGSRTTGSMLAEREIIPRHMKNAEAERRLYRDMTTMCCTCTSTKPRTVNRQSSYVYRAWASLAISTRVNVQNMHQPGCAFYDNQFSTTSTKTTFSYTGLSFLLGHALDVSRIQDSISRASGISFTLRPCRVVESSPAFRLFQDYPRFQKSLSAERDDTPEQEVKKLMRKLRDLYSSGDASPFDVDQCGENIGHYCVKYFFLVGNPAIRFGPQGDALCTFLSYLSCLGVPITTTHLGPSTILDTVVGWDATSTVLPKVYDTLVKCIPGFDPEDSVRTKRRFFLFSPPEAWIILNKYRERLDMFEAFGFGDLILAIMRQDQPKLETILEAPQSLDQISETDHIGRNVLHLSSGWAIGLRLLLKHKATHSLLNQYSSFRLSPLGFALLYSKHACTATDQWTICHECPCYMPAQLLLEADCSVMVGVNHSDRRKRLRDIALVSLSPETLSCYGVDANTLPDATATTLYKKLQKQGHELSSGLVPTVRFCFEDSLFTYPLHPKVAELALNLGIQPFNDCKVPYIVMGNCGSYLDDFEEVLVYIDWLIRNGIRTDLCTDFLKLSVAHNFADIVGKLVYEHYRRHKKMPQLQRPEFTRVLLAISRSEVESRLPCPYMTKPFNRPLAHFLFTSINIENYRLRKWQRLYIMSMLVELMRGIIDNQEAAYLARCAIHILTYLFLGVRHLSECYEEDNETLEQIAEDPSIREEWAELVDEDRPLIEQANKLANDFEEEFQRQNVSITEFLRGHWRRKMRKVRRSNAKLLTDSRKGAMLEIGVVLNNTRGSISDSDSWDSSDDEE
ncbi:hypothetical protein FSARC_12486 [Fusarium sarcochroum]|uniref:Fungal N-terminal domain-containing protein n=1 Tax=Fusarium sarcochroum TaxID=1208366 RepID=A0A8H4T834_9HYPO|nr:hypothetical protein FSARC_12486 [Fusarium sarcochroum]